MRIRRRVERLEASGPPTVATLIDQLEREATNFLSREPQRDVHGHHTGLRPVGYEAYQEALSKALREVSDEDLDRMIAFVSTNVYRAEFRQ